MLYRNFCGLELSALGLGTMRFPTVKEGDVSVINEEETEKVRKTIKLS